MKLSFKSILTVLFLSSVIIFAGISIIKKHVKKNNDGSIKIESDVIVYVNAAKSIINSENIYFDSNGEKNSYVYLPFFAFINIPLILFQPLVIDISWYCINIILLVLTIYLSYNLFTNKNLSQESYKTKWFFIGWSIFLSLRYIIRNFQDANVNIVLLFFIIISFYLYYQKNNKWGLLFIGFAAAIKLFPLIFLIYFLMKKEFKGALIIFFGFVCSSFLPLFVINFHTFSNYIIIFYQYSQKMFSSQGTMVENYSIWGTLVRLFTNTPAFILEGKVYFANLFSINIIIIKCIVYIINICILFYMFYNSSQERKKQDLQFRFQHIEWVIVLLLMNFVSILIEEFHVVTFLVAYLYLLVAYKEYGELSKRSYFIIIFSGIFSILTAHDILVRIVGKDIFMRILSLSIPLLPIGIILILFLNYLFRNSLKINELKNDR